MKTIFFTALVTASSCLTFAQDMQDQLRLKAGNYWVYEGTVEWTFVNTVPARIGKKHITWKSEILEGTTRGDLKAFLVLGSVADLAWYEPGMKRGQYIWIIHRNRFFIIAADPKILARFRNPKDPLRDMVLAEEPILQFPLRLRSCTVEIKPEEPRQRTDSRYCWYLQNRRKEMLNIGGVPPNVVEVWTTRYQTIPLHEALGFAPSVGFVTYDFSHHGTIAEAHVKLIEAHLQ